MPQATKLTTELELSHMVLRAHQMVMDAEVTVKQTLGIHTVTLIFKPPESKRWFLDDTEMELKDIIRRVIGQKPIRLVTPNDAG